MSYAHPVYFIFVLGSVVRNDTHLGDDQTEIDNERTIIRKDLYMELPDVTARTFDHVIQWREKNRKVTIKQPSREKDFEVRPCETFDEAFKRFPDILERVKNLKIFAADGRTKISIEKPTPIQSQLWPIALKEIVVQ